MGWIKMEGDERPWLAPTFWTWGAERRGIISSGDWCSHYKWRSRKANDLYSLTPLMQKIYRQVNFEEMRRPNRWDTWSKRI